MSDKVIFVTGAAGFIGSRFVHSCNFNSMPAVSADSLAYFDSRSEHQGIDFGEKIDLESAFEWLEQNASRVTTIVHLGAISQTTSVDEESVRKYNLEYSKRLWNFATKAQIPFVYASSAATYGDGSGGFDDDETCLTQLNPTSPYARSKHAFDLWVLGQEKMGHHPPAWSGFKFFNVFGFGERHKSGMWSVVLNTYEQVRSTGRMKLFKSDHPDFGDGEQTRDFIYIEDVLDTLWFAIELPFKRGIYNLGTGASNTFLQMAQWTFEAMGKTPEIEFVPKPKNISRQYQYYTQAKMDKLKATGFRMRFYHPKEAVQEYVEQLNHYYQRLALRDASECNSETQLNSTP